MTESAWLDCSHPGCPRGTYVDPRHLGNLTAGGGQLCAFHEYQSRSNQEEDDPC